MRGGNRGMPPPLKFCKQYFTIKIACVIIILLFLTPMIIINTKKLSGQWYRETIDFFFVCFYTVVKCKIKKTEFTMPSDNDWLQHAEDKLWELADGAEITTQKVDKDGNEHTLKAKMPPNVDAVKFILKNRGKGKWADKIETTTTNINISLSARYDEVKELMEKQKEKSSQEQLLKDNIIEAELVKKLESEQ